MKTESKIIIEHWCACIYSIIYRDIIVINKHRWPKRFAYYRGARVGVVVPHRGNIIISWPRLIRLGFRYKEKDYYN